MKNSIKPILASLLTLCQMSSAQQDPQKGAVSVHLRYLTEPTREFYNEVTVTDSAPGTYFAVCGWNNGYFGIQELNGKPKTILFSIWDSDNNDKDAVDPNQQVRVIFKDPAARDGRFGNEGSGGQIFLDFDWMPNTKYSFFVRSYKEGDRNQYAAYFRSPTMGEWKCIGILSTAFRAGQLEGLYSFVEDFERTVDSSKQLRRAEFSGGWTRDDRGEMKPAYKANFTAFEPSESIDADSLQNGFFLMTGGVTRNVSKALGTTLSLNLLEPPNDLPTPKPEEK